MNWIVSNRQSFSLFLPEMLLIGVSILVLLHGAFFSGVRKFAVALGLLGVFGYIALSIQLLNLPSAMPLFSGAIAVDPFAVFFKIFFGFVTAITMILVYRSQEFQGYSLSEVVGFLLALTVGMSMMAASTDLIMMFLSLEMVSVLSYILVGYKKHSRVSAEAGLKYILYGAVASGVMMFGFSYLYGLAGSTDLQDVAATVRTASISSAPILFFALLCVLTGFGFKIATFPTQMWCPDVYEGAALPVTAFLSVGPKAAGFALMIRFFYTLYGFGGSEVAQIFDFIHWGTLVAILAALTMTVGNLAAIGQHNIKRLMAYSSIAHAGYLLMGFAALSTEGIRAILFYLVTYFLMNFGAFIVILMIADRLGTEEIDGYRGLGWRSPILAATFSIFLFSLTGLPPFAGFVGKFFLFAAVIKGGMYWLAVIAVINSVISLFYYARIIKAMYLETPLELTPVAVSKTYRSLACLMALPTIVLGIYWEPVIAFAARSVAPLF